MAYNIDEIMALPKEERLEIAEELFLSVHDEDNSPIDLLPGQMAELKRRIERADRGEATYRSWEEVEKDIFGEA